MVNDLFQFAVILFAIAIAAVVVWAAWKMVRKVEKTDHFNELQKTPMYLGIALVTAAILFGVVSITPISFQGGSRLEKGEPPNARGH